MPALFHGRYSIRSRLPEDDEALLAVENRATELFRDHGYPMVADTPLASIADFRTMMVGHETWIAVSEGGEAVGYAVAGSRGHYFHLRELAVDPDHQRRGIGTALVQTVAAAAAKAGCPGITLTTFRDVPFNAPFYARLGFKEMQIDDAPEALRTTFLREVPHGVDAGRRVLMLKELPDS